MNEDEAELVMLRSEIQRAEVLRELEAERDALKAELARIKDAEPTPCPVDHSCEGEQSCGCWCDLHDVPIAECPTFMLVSSWIESRDRELAEARAAIERVRALHFVRGRNIHGDDVCAACSPLQPYPCPTVAALDAPQRPEDTAQPCHIGGRANAEDCPACRPLIDKTVLYPYICPGEPERPEDTRERAEHTDRHGRTWDPHPFVQSQAIDNVAVCVCGQPPDHAIHRPEDTREEAGRG